MNKQSIEDFIKLLQEEFDDVSPDVFKPQTGFKDIEAWSSMHALIIIALVDANYDIVLDGEDLMGAETIEDLFNVIQSKVA